MTSNAKLLDPVQGLIDYVLDIKPYHTKIMEVLVEYVYNEPVDVTITDAHMLDIGLLQPINTNELMLSCEGGYAGRPYGDYNRYPVISPNVAITFDSYPAINSVTKSFTVPGNRAIDLKIGSSVYLATFLHTFISSIDSGTSTITVVGDYTVSYTAGTVFEIDGSNAHDGAYVVSVDATFDGSNTNIIVTATLAPVEPNTLLGSIRSSQNNTGVYTVTSAIFSAGFIDSWPDVDDVSTYTLGDDPHTVITVFEPLNAIPVIGSNQIYVASMSISPVVVEGALYYSNYLEDYIPSPPSLTNNPDEGFFMFEIVGVTLSTLDGFGFPIPDTGKFTVIGDTNQSNIFVGNSFKVSNSIGNDGTYTISSIVYDGGLNQTTFGVEDLVDDSIVGGTATVDIASNVLIVDGDLSNRFTQGIQFNVVGGTIARTYTTLSSDYVDDKTRIRVAADIFDEETGYSIISNVGGFVLSGDKTSILPVGHQFNVIGSNSNDGRYVVAAAGPSYDVGLHQTTIPVDDTINSVLGGTLHPYITGVITERHYGYSESSNLCGNVPDTLVRVLFGEKLSFDGLGPSTLTLSDDVIAYNIENTDASTFDFPLGTIISPTQPILLEQSATPVGTYNDIWFDTTVVGIEKFKQYNGYRWVNITTVWWFDSANNLLSYRTKNANVDTGWVLDFQNAGRSAPGYNETSPAIGETEVIDVQYYSIDDLGSGTPQDTFTLDTPVPNSDITLIGVTINSVPAEFSLNSATEFTIISPFFKPDNIVIATVSDRTRTETNARVSGMSTVPHSAYHSSISSDTVNGAYIVGGGNFIDRFTSATHFDAFIEEVSGGSSVSTNNIDSFPILAVDDITNTINVSDDYTWLFNTGNVFKVQTSENNYNEFEVQSSTFDGTQTIIVVQSTVVTEVPVFYNPGVVIYNIDNVSDTIIVLGDVEDVYTAGLIVQVSNSTSSNNIEWTVQSTIYDDINDRTNIKVAGNIPDPDSSASALLHTQIFQNYSRDLGVVWGAVYDPDSSSAKEVGDVGYDPLVDGVYNIGQVKTIVVPITPLLVGATGIVYDWVGPLRMELTTNRQDDLHYGILDGLGVSDELLGIPDSFSILYTDDPENYFVISHTDPVTGSPVDLTDSFSKNTIFDVKGSYSNNTPVTTETNDAKYAVLQSFFDDPTNHYVATGGETKVVWKTVYTARLIYKNGTLLTEGVDYSITAPNETCFGDPTDCPLTGVPLVGSDILVQVPVGVPSTWATGSGKTFIQIDNDYDNIPPYNEFDVVEVSNNIPVLPIDPDEPNTLTLTGNHVTLFESFASGIFRLDVPLVSADPKYNVITVTDIKLDGTNTVLTVQEEFIDEAYTGALGIIESVYSVDVFYDANNTTLPWVDGTIFREVFKLDQADTTLTATAIDDQLIFGWGTVIQWNIVLTDRVANFEIIDIDGNVGTPDVRLYRGSLSIDGDQTTAIELNERFNVRGSAGNDGEYEVAVMAYNVGNDDTDITPHNQPRTFEVTTIADVAGNLNNTYFNISSPSTQYYVWMDVDNTGTDPAIAGKIGIEVHVPINATADTVATNIEYAITKTGAFNVSYDANIVLIDVSSSGEPQQYAYDVDTGFTVDNYTLPRQPASNQFGIFELENVDVTNWYQYLIQQMEPVANEIIIIGNAIGDVQNGQQVRIIGTNNNDRIFTVSAIPTYDTATSTTVVPVAEIIQYGTNEITELPSTTQIKVIGNSAKFLDGDDIVNIVNSTGNDGVYSIVGVEYETPYSILTVSPSLPDNTPDGDVQYVDRGGWIEAVRYQGIHIFYEDTISITTMEVADAATLTSGDNFVDSWDAYYWDVGSFDESLGTVIHLYSGTF